MMYFNKYSLTVMVAMMFLSLCGCNKESIPETIHEEGDQIMKLAVSRSSVGSDAENAIRTLRIMVFSAEDKSMLYNEQYFTANASATPPVNSNFYIVKTLTGYDIAAMLPKKSIYVLVVANEIASLDGNDSFDYVRGQVLDYAKWYGTGNTLNINIQGNDRTSNKGYVPMTGETPALAPYQWKSDEGKAVIINLERNLTKINLKLKSSGLIGASPGDVVTISSASVTHIPSYSFMGNTGQVYEDKLYSTDIKYFTSPLIINTTAIDQSTNTLSFYVPEYLLGEQFFTEAQYAYIQINAVFKSATETFNSVYKIPLGDGMQKLYDTPPTPIDKLTRSDLALTRNTEYNVEATVQSTGRIQALQMNINIKDWAETIDVDGDDESPLLNVAKLIAKMDANTVRVYFWTNTPKVYVEGTGLKNNATDFVVNDIFTELSGVAGAETTNFKLFKEADNIYYPYNGYLDLMFNDLNLYTEVPSTYRITLNAGGLKRSINVQANPVVGEVVFDTNGGTFADGNTTITHEIHYAQLGGEVLTAINIDLVNPKNEMTPPEGMTFKHWSYSLAEDLIVTNSNNSTCTVTPKGYITTLYAVWK